MSMFPEDETPLTPGELNVLRKQFLKEGEHVTVQTKFNYAWGLIRSSKKKDVEEGIQLMYAVYDSSPERQRECLFYTAIGNYKIGDLAEAKYFVGRLLKLEPGNEQALEFDRRIDERTSTDGKIGLAIVSGALALGIAITTTILKKMK